MIKLLFHPLVTLTATAVGLGSAAGACVAIIAALDPVTHLPVLQSLIPFIHRIDGDLMATSVILSALAGICTAVAGAGRSFISSIDAGKQ